MQKSRTLGSVGGGFRKESVYPTLKYFFEEMEKTGGKGKNLMNRYFRKRF